jgi:hypothetical protein
MATPPVPPGVVALPKDAQGRPLPWFSARLPDGSYNLRVASARKFDLAYRRRLCPVCGRPLGRLSGFVGRPVDVVRREFAQPPGHVECLEFSLRNCPFLLGQTRRRGPAGLPPDAVPPPQGCEPGAKVDVPLALYCTARPVSRSPSGLFVAGPPKEVSWWLKGERLPPHLARAADGLVAQARRAFQRRPDGAGRCTPALPK